MASRPSTMQIWEIIIAKISKLIKARGKDPVVINIDARLNTKEQFDMYMNTCRMVKDRYEVIVTTGLPGEERIFWPNQDAQFYIHPDGKVNATGNADVVKSISN